MTNQNKPTTAELEILAVLWERGSATVKEVHEILNSNNRQLIRPSLNFCKL